MDGGIFLFASEHASELRRARRLTSSHLPCCIGCINKMTTTNSAQENAMLLTGQGLRLHLERA